MTFLRQIQVVLERTYQSTGINLEDCLIDFQRYRMLSHASGADAEDLSPDARTFLRLNGGNLHIAIYYHPSVIETLERNNPLQSLNDENIRSLIIFLEEIDHAIHAALKFKENGLQDTSESLLRDLEVQARVDTYLLLKLIAGAIQSKKSIAARQSSWLRRCLFKKECFSYQKSHLRRRYQRANRMGLKLARYLDRCPCKKRISFIRKFRAMNFFQKQSCIQSL